MHAFCALDLQSNNSCLRFLPCLHLFSPLSLGFLLSVFIDSISFSSPDATARFHPSTDLVRSRDGFRRCGGPGPDYCRHSQLRLRQALHREVRPLSLAYAQDPSIFFNSYLQPFPGTRSPSRIRREPPATAGTHSRHCRWQLTCATTRP